MAKIAKKQPSGFDVEFAFHQQLQHFYNENRGKIRSRYNDLTKKFLAFNDKRDNPEAFLRLPQFEALEMYVFVKEFMDNKQVYEIFDEWRKREGNFSDRSYYSLTKGGQVQLFYDESVEQNEAVFKQMKNYREDYPNYIYALTMGLGKTILMATCIFYEFLLANKYPKDERFCHNALVFAPDKTVLQSLRNIVTFDKVKVVPPEYVNFLDTNIKFHFLEESGTTLNAIDDSDFNIVISNNQKIIVKKKHKKDSPSTRLFQSSLLSTVYGEDDEADSEELLIENQRFKRLCRLSKLGIYVDEAHHLFGAKLEEQIRSGKGEKTSLRNTINAIAKKTSIVACYNYTGTPYVKRQLLPEVVYAYGLKESIWNGFLKDTAVVDVENVKEKDFLKAAIKRFWDTYGENKYEGLLPKMAIFASTVEEANGTVRPIVEEILAELGISASKILINVGESKITKAEDIRDFNNLDVVGTHGCEKQFVILVEKGREGWDCRSLFSVALFRSPKSKVFVLQATMRCLRQITDEQQSAIVFLSKANADILNDELNQNFNMELKDLTNANKDNNKQLFKVRMLPPPRTIKLKHISYHHTLVEKGTVEPIDFGFADMDFSKYSVTVREKSSIAREYSTKKEEDVKGIKATKRYSAFMLAEEVARYLNISCVRVDGIIRSSIDGVELVLNSLNLYNEILHDVIIPKIWDFLFEVKTDIKSTDKEIILLRDPTDKGYYEFNHNPELVMQANDTTRLKPHEIAKSFHADTYCFDTKPEKELFMQYVTDDEKVDEIYFTGMFTHNQGELAIQYYDLESQRIRQYFPDFFAKMRDGTYQIIEVKGDHLIDEVLTKAKTEAANQLAVESGIEYKLYRSSRVMNSNVLYPNVEIAQQSLAESVADFIEC